MGAASGVELRAPVPILLSFLRGGRAVEVRNPLGVDIYVRNQRSSPGWCSRGKGVKVRASELATGLQLILSPKLLLLGDQRAPEAPLPETTPGREKRQHPEKGGPSCWGLTQSACCLPAVSICTIFPPQTLQGQTLESRG